MARTQFSPITRRITRAAGSALLISGLALGALSAPVAAQVPDIQVRQAPYRLSISDASPVLEGNDGQRQARFTVTLQRPPFGFVPPPGQVFVQYNTISGTAVSNGDFAATTGSLLFDPLSALEPSVTREVLVPINGDLADEADEIFSLRLFNQTDNAELADAEGLGTIVDDDPLPRVSIANASVLEGNDSVGQNELAFEVSLDHPLGEVVLVDYATLGVAELGDTALRDVDFVGEAGTLRFFPGQTRKTIRVVVKGDTLDEGNESFRLLLSNPRNAVLANSSAFGVIRDDDPLPRLSIRDAVLREPASGRVEMVFNVVLSAPIGEAVRVAYTTENGTATAGSGDYVAEQGLLVIPAGETSGQIRIAIQADARNENDEVFFVRLSNAINAVLNDSQAIGTIIDLQ